MITHSGQFFGYTTQWCGARHPYTHAGAAAVCEDAGHEVIEAAPDGGYAAVLGHVVGMDTRFFSDEEIHRVHELPHWKDLDNLHHKVSYHLSTKLVARKPPSN